MKFIQQKTRFSVKPIHEGGGGGVSNLKRHGPLLPDSIRCIICGPSNCGKTNLMLSLLLDPHTLRFNNCYVYSKSLRQPKYQYLQGLLKKLPRMGTYFHENEEDMVPPEKAKPDSIVIFDDVACQNQDVIRAYFSMGRHSGVDVFYLCQSYAHAPKHLVRDNANLLMIFKEDDLNLRHLYEAHAKVDMSFEDFRNMCRACWDSNKYGYLVINHDSPVDNGKYRRGLDEFIRPG